MRLHPFARAFIGFLSLLALTSYAGSDGATLTYELSPTTLVVVRVTPTDQPDLFRVAAFLHDERLPNVMPLMGSLLTGDANQTLLLRSPIELPETRKIKGELPSGVRFEAGSPDLATSLANDGLLAIRSRKAEPKIVTVTSKPPKPKYERSPGEKKMRPKFEAERLLPMIPPAQPVTVFTPPDVVDVISIPSSLRNVTPIRYRFQEPSHAYTVYPNRVMSMKEVMVPVGTKWFHPRHLIASVVDVNDAGEGFSRGIIAVSDKGGFYQLKNQELDPKLLERQLSYSLENIERPELEVLSNGTVWTRIQKTPNAEDLGQWKYSVSVEAFNHSYTPPRPYSESPIAENLKRVIPSALPIKLGSSKTTLDVLKSLPQSPMLVRGGPQSIAEESQKLMVSSLAGLDTKSAFRTIRTLIAQGKRSDQILIKLVEIAAKPIPEGKSLQPELSKGAIARIVEYAEIDPQGSLTALEELSKTEALAPELRELARLRAHELQAKLPSAADLACILSKMKSGEGGTSR